MQGDGNRSLRPRLPVSVDNRGASPAPRRSCGTTEAWPSTRRPAVWASPVRRAALIVRPHGSRRLDGAALSCRCRAAVTGAHLGQSPSTVPALCAEIGCSIFIASRTTTRSPSHAWPVLDGDLDDRPCIGEVRAPRTPGAARARPPLAAAWPRRRAGPRAASPAGRETSRRRPPTSTGRRLPRRRPRRLGRRGGVRRDLVVPLGLDPAGVHVNGSLVKASSRTTARWNGTTVGMPRRRARPGRGGRAAAPRRGGAGDDQLGQHGVERAGHLAAGLDARSPSARRGPAGSPAGDRARERA
jgi:hypothetical protein